MGGDETDPGVLAGLTEEQGEAVDRLLMLHYLNGVSAAIKAVAETMNELGPSVENVLSALNNLAAAVGDELDKEENQ